MPDAMSAPGSPAHAQAAARSGPDTVEVTACARLHLGFLDLDFALGRHFGSIGLALDRPRTRLALSRSPRTEAEGPDSDRAARHLHTMVAALGLPAGHRLRLDEAIPAHAGLGSGTQLALAVASALRRLHGLAPDPRGDAARLDRGARSGIGVGLFEHGGLVVDGGRGARTGTPPLLARLAFPAHWRVLLLLDRSHRGLSGGAELAAFAALPPIGAAAAGEICRLVLMQALPAVAEADLLAFGAAIARMQAILGDHFAAAQGARVASPRVAAALGRLAAGGATGGGQSSWGPTGFAFLPDAAAASAAAALLAEDPAGAGLDILACRTLNRGATIAAR